jgi:multidrug resistance protein MdtO
MDPDHRVRRRERLGRRISIGIMIAAAAFGLFVLYRSSHRVLGFLMGFAMMWLVFDQLWRRSAAVAMKRAFISTLRLVVQLARQPVGKVRSDAIQQSYSLRETINRSLDGVRAYADGVLFEYGPSRPQNLALRDRVRRWNAELRVVFVMQVALLKFRLQVHEFENVHEMFTRATYRDGP